MSTEIELAGFFDGEGNVRIHQGKGSASLKVQIAQVDREVLDRFYVAVDDTGSVSGPYGPYPYASRKPQYRYQANDRKGERVLNLIWPYLASVKRAQARKAIDQINHIRSSSKSPRRVAPYEVPA